MLPWVLVLQVVACMRQHVGGHNACTRNTGTELRPWYGRTDGLRPGDTTIDPIRPCTTSLLRTAAVARLTAYDRKCCYLPHGHRWCWGNRTR